jgi:molecular chaperone DnaJ
MTSGVGYTHPPMPGRIPDDYYALLGVHAGANRDELRAAWRRLAAQWHPDRAGDGATARFQQLSAAYDVLCDPIARAAYDRRRPPAAPGPTGTSAAVPRTAATTAASSRWSEAARQPVPATMLGRLCGSLSTLLACGAAQYDDDDPGLITLVLRGDEAAQGGMVTISMRVELWCPACAAQERSAGRAGCPRCGGSGSVDELYSAWLAVPPAVPPGEVLAPSADLPGMMQPVRFRVRLAR